MRGLQEGPGRGSAGWGVSWMGGGRGLPDDGAVLCHRKQAPSYQTLDPGVEWRASVWYAVTLQPYLHDPFPTVLPPGDPCPLAIPVTNPLVVNLGQIGNGAASSFVGRPTPRVE